MDLGGTPAPWRFLFKHRAFKTEPNCSVFMFLQVIKHATHQHHETGTLDDSPTINKTFQTALLFFSSVPPFHHFTPPMLGWFLGIEKVVKGQDERILLGTMDPWLGSPWASSLRRRGQASHGSMTGCVCKMVDFTAEKRRFQHGITWIMMIDQ